MDIRKFTADLMAGNAESRALGAELLLQEARTTEMGKTIGTVLDSPPATAPARASGASGSDAALFGLKVLHSSGAKRAPPRMVDGARSLAASHAYAGQFAADLVGADTAAEKALGAPRLQDWPQPSQQALAKAGNRSPRPVSVLDQNTFIRPIADDEGRSAAQAAIRALYVAGPRPFHSTQAGIDLDHPA